MDGGTGLAPFAQLLRRLREERSLTQEELAARSGLTAKAVGALERGERTRPYPHTVRSLADGLGLAEEQRAALVASLRDGARPPAATARPDPAAEVSPPALGPAAALLGRDEELQRVLALVRAPGPRVVTVTGPGGVGKTSLARQVAALLAPELSTPPAVVELADVRDPATVLPRVAALLGVPEVPGSGTAADLAPFLAGRRMLLVLDNLEQVLGCGPALAELVTRCPELSLLATSRAPLRVRPEHEVPLGPLAVPPPVAADPDLLLSYPAVALFLERAAAAGTPLELDVGTAAAVAGVCRHLEGLPLAIELAAAGLRLLTPAALLDRLRDGASTGQLRDLPARQRTVAATLDWSHDLLAPEEQTLFARLAVFAGEFGLPGVEALADDPAEVLAPLATLVDHALVTRVPAPGAEPRFRLLEPVRQYAALRLARRPDAHEVAARHAEHYRALGLEVRPALQGPALAGALDRLEAAHGNLGAALLWLADAGRPGEAAAMLHHLWLYLALRGHAREGLTWSDRLGPLPMDDVSRCAWATGTAGLRYLVGDVPRVRELAGDALILARTLGRDDLRAEAGLLAASGAMFAGDAAAARLLLAEVPAEPDGLDPAWVRAHTLLVRGQAALVGGDLVAAGEELRRAERAARAVGNDFTLATTLNVRATLTELRDEHVTSVALLTEAVRISVRSSLTWTLGYAVPALAGVAVRLGEAEVGARLYGASASLSAAHAVDPEFPALRPLVDRDLRAAREQLGPDDFGRAWDTGRSAGPAELAALAEELRRRARA